MHSKQKIRHIDALISYINPSTGRIHSSFYQTATGRISSSRPNLQNIPRVSNLGGEIRSAFKPKKDHLFLSVDYAQCSLCIVAQLSQDKNLIDAFLQQHDIHAQTAAGLFNVAIHKVTPEQRQIGKRVNLSIINGCTPFGLSKELGISCTEAKLYIQHYFMHFPMLALWIESSIEDAKKQGYVSTLWGRKCMVPGIYEKNRSKYQAAKRAAINAIIQGSITDIINLGMIRLHKLFYDKNIDAAIVLQIHDELLISAHKDQIDIVQQLVKETLESIASLRVPLQVTIKIGNNWKEVSK